MAARAGSRPPRKIFHKIGEVCDLTKTEPYVLRYWESEFPFLAPEKNRAGQRIYTDDDIETVLAIKRLLYEEGYTTAGARRRLEKEREEGVSPVVAVEGAGAELPPATAEAPSTPAAQTTAQARGGDDDLRRALAGVRDGLRAIRSSLTAPLPEASTAVASLGVAPPVTVADKGTKTARAPRRGRK